MPSGIYPTNQNRGLETKLKLRSSRLGKPQIRTAAGKKAFSEKMRGHLVSMETRKKIGLGNSISLKGNTPWNKGKAYPHITGKKHFAWKADKVGYRALHSWVRRMMGKAIECEHCGKQKTTPKSIHWANKSHQYKRELNDWISLCVKCHKKYDGYIGKVQ